MSIKDIRISSAGDGIAVLHSSSPRWSVWLRRVLRRIERRLP